MAEPLSPATTVTEAFNEVNPDVALGPDDPRHVDFTRWRGDDPIAARVASRIQRASAADGRYIKQLVAGHRGSGKTTELYRLKERLDESDFVVIYFDSAEEVDINNVDYADVLLATISQVTSQAQRHDLFVPVGSLEQLRAKLEPIVRDVVTETTRTAEAEGGAEAKGGLWGVGGFFAKARAAIKNDATKREQVRTVLRQSPTLFLEDLNDIIDNLQTQIRSRGKAGLVVIIDSLDRIVPNPLPDGRTTHSQIFVTHADQLKAPRCHMVFTVPISLTFDQNLGTHYSTEPIVQPMVRVREQNGAECEGAIRAMVDAVGRRIHIDTLFETPEDVRTLCLFSGGHIRDLMHLLTKASDYAEDRFTTQSVQQATRSLTRDYDRLVRDADLPRLVQVHRDKRLPTDSDFALLPYHLIVLEYQNGEPWADVHPAVQATRKFREAWERRDTPLATDG